MKYYIILIVLLCASCSQTKNIVQGNQSLLYRITKIKKEKSIFIIYAERNDSLFKIVSENNKKNILNCEEIRKGEYYNLKLDVIYPVEYYPLLGIKGSGNFLDVVFTINNIAVPLEEKSHYKLYKAENLNGLCAIKENEE